MKLIIAANYRRYLDYLKDSGDNRSDCVYGRDALAVCGYTFAEIILYDTDYKQSPLWNSSYFLMIKCPNVSYFQFRAPTFDEAANWPENQSHNDDLYHMLEGLL